MIILRKKASALALAFAVSVFLSGCQTTNPVHEQRAAKIDSVMARAAEEARTQGNMQQSLSILEKMYKRQSSNPDVALKYAKALREEGYYSRASLVLTPFASDEKTSNVEIMTEYAALQTAMGQYLNAEETARKAVIMQPESGKAYHVLGVALDAQGFHEQAGVAFEKGLDYWEGDPSPILNNMGLNLAAQGFLDEAIETLRKALDTAPNRTEIERNIRIVSALQYQPPKRGARLVPKPPKKPGDEIVENTRVPAPVPGTEEPDVVEAPEIEEVMIEATELPATLEDVDMDVDAGMDANMDVESEEMDNSYKSERTHSQYN